MDYDRLITVARQAYIITIEEVSAETSPYLISLKLGAGKLVGACPRL